MKNFIIRDGEKVPSAIVADITLTIGVHGDSLMIEQPGDNDEPDLVIVYGKEDGEALVARIQEWLNEIEKEVQA